MHNLIIFASGRGSNAQAIIDYFGESDETRVALIVTNKADAGVIDVAKKENIPFIVASRAEMAGDEFLSELISYKPSLVILAGFLLKIPNSLIDAFPNKIINIHPALLPGYGGKGMWGHHVHSAVINSGDKQSGISIHAVDEVYDHGAVILQARCPVLPGDTPETLAARIHKLEHYYFPRTIEFLLNNEGQYV